MTQDTKIVARTQTVALAETYLIVLLCCALVACFFGSAQLIIGEVHIFFNFKLEV